MCRQLKITAYIAPALRNVPTSLEKSNSKRVLAGLEIAIPQNPLWVFSPMIDQLYSTNVLQLIYSPRNSSTTRQMLRS